MCIISDRQKTFSFSSVRISARRQWEMISDILDANPDVAALVRADLTTDKHRKRKKNTGARGMTAEQVLRISTSQLALITSRTSTASTVPLPSTSPRDNATELAAEAHTTDTRRIGNKDCG